MIINVATHQAVFVLRKIFSETVFSAPCNPNTDALLARTLLNSDFEIRDALALGRARNRESYARYVTSHSLVIALTTSVQSYEVGISKVPFFTSEIQHFVFLMVSESSF